MLTCKNCKTEFNGSYCSNCGQKYIDKRFTVKDSIYWAFHSIFNFDKGFFHTSLDMVVKPGKVIQDFLNGITIRYAHPFRFIFIWASLAAILGIWAGVYQDTSIAMNEAMGASKAAIQNASKVQGMMGKYMSFVYLIMIPFYSLGSYLMFRSKKLNYAEHLITNSFAISSSIMIGIPLTIVYGFNPHVDIINYLNFGLGVIVMSRIYSQVFKTNWIATVGKYILSFLITILSFAIVLIIIMIIVSIVLHLLGVPNPFVPSKPV